MWFLKSSRKQLFQFPFPCHRKRQWSSLFGEHFLIALAAEHTRCPFGYPVAIKISYSPAWERISKKLGSQVASFKIFWRYLWISQTSYYFPQVRDPLGWIFHQIPTTPLTSEIGFMIKINSYNSTWNQVSSPIQRVCICMPATALAEFTCLELDKILSDSKTCKSHTLKRQNSKQALAIHGFWCFLQLPFYTGSVFKNGPADLKWRLLLAPSQTSFSLCHSDFASLSLLLAWTSL